MDRELPDKRGVLLEMYDERAFSRDVIRHFPELAADLTENENLLHIQVAVLGRVVRDEIGLSTPRLAPRIFAFLEQALHQPRAISEIENAIVISFVEVEAMRDTDAGREMLRIMPSTLRSVLTGGLA